MRTTSTAWMSMAAAVVLGLSCQACVGEGVGVDAGPVDAIADDALPSCWTGTCPGDPTATICGTCVHHLHDVECPPGFVCACNLTCVKGPRSLDGGVCGPDAGVTADAGPGPDATPAPDAQIYDWPTCEMRHRGDASP